MLHRLMMAQKAGVPMVNYGVLIAYVLGILKRALFRFPQVLEILENKKCNTYLLLSLITIFVYGDL